MFNKDQASKLRDLAEQQGVNQKEEPLTYSAIIGEDRRDSSHESNSLAVKGVIIAVTGLVLFGVVIAAFFILQQNEAKYKEIIKSMNQQGQALKNQLSSVTEKTKQLENNLQVNLDKNRELVSQLRNLDGTNVALNSQLTVLASERKQLLQQISDTRQKAAELERARQALQVQMQENTAATKEVISGLQSKVAMLDSKLAALPSISVVPAESSRIVLINQQEDFVLVNKGSASGYKNGMRLAVFREGVPVAELVVNAVRDQVSACDIVSLTNALRLQDEVRVK
jgi:hypothetical protein